MEEKRLIDVIPLMQNGWHLVQTGESNRFLASKSLADVPTVDAVEVVRCNNCKFADPYQRMDGLTGYYCMCDKNSFTYDQNWDRQFNPVKESNDFCSYGERKSNGES